MSLKFKIRFFLLSQYLLPQHLLSRLIGRLADCEITWIKNILIQAFIKRFNIKLEQAKIKDPYAHKSFNAFFIRELADGFPLSLDSSKTLCSPAEALLSEYGAITQGQLIQAKAREYSLECLLAQETALAALFKNGSFATLYLAPFNYHRVHMPIDGQLETIMYVPGKLFSVNLITAAHVPELFAKNERLIMIFNTHLGKLAVIMVGAMLVAGIKNHFIDFTAAEKKSLQKRDVSHQNIAVKQGDELGYFDFGSTVILLTERIFQFDIPGGPGLQLGDRLGFFTEST
jgi:phosphatidylserine decarboxylase